MTTYFKYLLEKVLTKSIEKGEFPFSQYFFGNTSVEEIDIAKNKNYVIERV
jgi:hypothetical protein